MRLAHLILVHNQPKQLERLINRLAHPEADIYIHLDKKTSMDEFEYLKSYENVFFIKDRVKVYWGSYNIVQATLNGFKEIMLSGKGCQYLNLLSGQDYPLKPADEIHQYLNEHAGTIFMNYLRFKNEWTDGLPRIEKYHFNNLQMRGRYVLQWLANKVLPKRRLPNGLIPVGRSQWFTMPMEAVNYILGYWEGNANLRRFIKLTWAPDEFVFQTILFNSDYREKMVNENLRYIDWSAGGVSPKNLTMDDAGALAASGAFYARKFDMSKDEEILNLLDSKQVISSI